MDILETLKKAIDKAAKNELVAKGFSEGQAIVLIEMHDAVNAVLSRQIKQNRDDIGHLANAVDALTDAVRSLLCRIDTLEAQMKGSK